jgi:hypothetical protein
MNDDDEYVNYVFTWWDVVQIILCVVMAGWSAWDAWFADTTGDALLHSGFAVLFILSIWQIIRECRDD